MTRASVALVGTFPPTECGLATFTRSSATALSDGRRVGVIELVDEPRGKLASLVCSSWTRGNKRSREDAVAVLNGFDSVIIQHEFGIFGGIDGDEVVELVKEIEVPIIVVIHTVLQAPSPHQRFILERLASFADALVTLSETAKRRLLETTQIDPTLVCVIPHGAHALDRPPTVRALGPGTTPVVLTWGLLGPGKGIEHVIDAIALLGDLEDPPEYWVVGETHPKVRSVAGESYRQALIDRAARAGISSQVVFFDGYRDLQSLHDLIAHADVVALPYDSREQVTSGVLVEAIAAGLPVVATAFPHATELVDLGCGLVVPHEDPAALSQALRTVLTDDGLRALFAAAARRVAPTLLWPAVGREFGALIDSCVAAHKQRHLDREVEVSA